MSAPDRVTGVATARWEEEAAWRAFVEAPARHVSRSRLRDCLGDVADDATLDALAGHPRFQGRLTQRLAQRHGLALPGTLSAPPEEDALLLALPAEAGATLAHHCGVICHALDFVREIRAPRVVALKQRFGESAFAAALANRELAVAGTSCDDIDALEREVHRDGAACLAAWLAGQPAELAAWLRLGLANELPEASHDSAPEILRQGPAIVRCAAAIVAAAAEFRESEHERTANTSGQGHPA